VKEYMPASEYEDEDEELYGVIEKIVEEVEKGATNTIVMGDWNSLVGCKSYRNTAGPHGLGRRNHKGQMLIDYCERNGKFGAIGCEGGNVDVQWNINKCELDSKSDLVGKVERRARKPWFTQEMTCKMDEEKK
jgi:hypothetical protein